MTDLNQMAMFRQKDVEKLFAASVFISPVAAIQQCGWLKPETILNGEVRKYWTSIRTKIQPDMMGDEAAEIAVSLAMEAGLTNELLAWSQDVTYSHLPAPYANEIARRAYMTKISGKLGDLVTAIQAADDTEMRRVIQIMSEQSIETTTKLPTAYDVATKFEEIVTNGTRSIPTYIPLIDSATGGLERQTLSVIAARPSVGKTAIAWQIAQQVAYAGSHVIFFSLEMSEANLWARAACPKVGTTWRDVRAGKLDKAQRHRLIEESYALSLQFEDKLKIIDSAQTTETIWRTVAEHRPDIIIVDHLRLLKDEHISEVKRLGIASQRLKDIAKNFDCASLLLAQLNRQSENRGEKVPILADLRDSGEIEENADLVIMLHRDDVQGVKLLKSETQAWIRKFRDGPCDILIKLIYDTAQQWFEGRQK